MTCPGSVNRGLGASFLFGPAGCWCSASSYSALRRCLSTHYLYFGSGCSSDILLDGSVVRIITIATRHHSNYSSDSDSDDCSGNRYYLHSEEFGEVTLPAAGSGGADPAGLLCFASDFVAASSRMTECSGSRSSTLNLLPKY